MNTQFATRGVILLLLIALAAASPQAATIVYNETELVRLLPEAVDPDSPNAGNITFVFSPPLNQSGEWQTDADDAGTYNVTISAFDGKVSSEEQITLIIQNVNQPPAITIEDIEISETEQLVLRPEASDPDNDPVTVTFSLPADANGTWQTGFDAAGNYSITITASDGKLETARVVQVTVKNRNRAPTIGSTQPAQAAVTIQEGTQQTFTVLASDVDADPLDYVWYIDREEKAKGAEFVYAAGYESAGTHTLRVEVIDGEATAWHEWTVEIENVNRGPTLEGLSDMTVHEDETLTLPLPEKDADGDRLTFAISEPIGSDGIWKPDFDDAKTYEITVSASDGSLSAEKTIIITVIDVDRTPELEQLADVSINETEELRLVLAAADPDGDKVRFAADGLEGAQFKDNTLTWTPGYDFIALPRNILGTTLSAMRLDRIFYPDEKAMPLMLIACGKEKCSNQTIQITVRNVNRRPVLEIADHIGLSEGQRLILRPSATDADGDYVRLSYTKPVGRWGRWKTSFDDAGSTTITVTASDGRESVEKAVKVDVQDVDRPPRFSRIADRTIKENQSIAFAVQATDPDGDNVTLVAENLPPGATFESGLLSWTPDFDTVNRSAGAWEFLLTFAATGRPGVTTKKAVSVMVKDANRKPVLALTAPSQNISAVPREKLTFAARAFDPDGANVTYRWKFSALEGIKGPQAVARTFTTPGTKEVKLIVSDGKATTTHTWLVTVGRPKPVATIPQTPPPATFLTFEVEG